MEQNTNTTDLEKETAPPGTNSSFTEQDKKFAQEPFQSGFNWKTIFAALFIGFVMTPGSIYLSLITGGSLGGVANWVTVILFVEIAKRSFISLKRQEIYIVYGVAGGLIAGVFSEKIFDQYFVQSIYARAFGLTNLIPTWVVPPAGSEALAKRTFFHKDWVVPLGLALLNYVLYRVNFYSLGYVLFRITSDIENLPFPLAPVAAEGSMALAETSAKSEGWRWRVFSVGTMIGIIFGMFYVVIPAVTGIMMTVPFTLIPIPWVDFTGKIGTILPTAMLGFNTDLGGFLAGFIIPFWVIVGNFVGSIGSTLIVNPLLYKYTGYMSTWRPGMTLIPTQIATNMDFWLSVTIGMGIIVSIIGISTITYQIVKDMRTRKKSGTKSQLRRELPPGRGDIPIWIGLVIWVISTLVYVVLCHILVPKFPLLLFIFFGFVLSPLLSYISARMFGITGVPTGVSFPMVREGTFILSGYKGADIWFAPFPYFDHGGVAQAFKQLELTKTKFISAIKSDITVLVISIFSSLFFWSIIWKMAPIPSSAYPFVEKMWPMTAIYKCLWTTATLEGGAGWMLKAIQFNLVTLGAVSGAVLYAVLMIFKLPIMFFYGVVGGISSAPHGAIPMFIGALFGRYYFRKRFGDEKWYRYTPVLLAGYGCGVGLVGMIGTAFALIVKAVSPLIF